MPRKRSREDYKKYLEKFENYVYLLWEEAIQLVNSLPERDYMVVKKFLEEYYKEDKSHYWSLTKLFAHAMYIPMFLQIGKSHFPRLVYIDTHSGPGLARIGPADDEIVLGSPLIALRWPQIIAQNVPQYRRIAKGFDKLYFVERDSSRAFVLVRLVKTYGSSWVDVRISNSNNALPLIIREEYNSSPPPLFYIFIDPYGSPDTQIEGRVLQTSLSGVKADILMTVFDAHLVRAFQGRANPELARRLFGEGFCRARLRAASRLCRSGNPERKDIIDGYRYLLGKAGYRTIKIIPVNMKNATIYHLILAVKRKTPPWLEAYEEYLSKVLPEPEVLKNIWKRVTGRLRSLEDFM